ncbi:MAG TPA: PQQ-binding-like beta-propeller repeat protein [Cellulomonas sp.]|nr:PQQ-binding-like beta-propeller repeat protein [Cellulomonas sp.]
MTRAVGSLREVELVEEGTDAPAVHRGRRWWWVLGGLVAVGALLVGGQATLDARRHHHEMRFDDVAGVLLPVPTHLSVLWHASPQAAELVGATQVGGHLVTAAATDDGYTVREIDRRTGRSVWTVHDAVDPAVDATGEVYGVCAGLGAADLVVCAISPVGPHGIPAEDLATQLVVVDAGDGSLVASWTTPLRMWTVGDGRITTASSATSGDSITWSLTSYDAHGTQEWHRTLDPVEVQPPPESDDWTLTYDLQLEAVDGYLLVADQGRAWRLHGGEVVDRLDVGMTAVELRPGGLVVTSRWGDAPSSTTLHLADGGTRALHGETLYTGIDDGSADDVLLGQEGQGTLVARDVRTGEERWTRSGASVGGIVLGGVVYLLADHGFGVSGPSLVALDAHTGATRWAQPQHTATFLMTDGRALYVQDDVDVHAFALDDGAVLPDRELRGLGEGRWLNASDGILVVRSADDDETTPVDVVG